MRIVLAGSSGFLGTALDDQLRRAGHHTVRLVRRRPAAAGEASWDPAAGTLDPAVLAGADAVVNLAGAGVGDHRWTPAYKATIRSSRVDTTRTVAAALAALPPDARPGVLLNASAVGWYGDTGDTVVDEAAPRGDGFLAEVCRDWEAAARPAADAGVRTCLLRTGLPLHRDGGLLKPQLLPYRLGLGGPFGGGRQWLPWISLHDWLRAVLHLLADAAVAGPVNVVGPAPVRNRDFTRALAAALHRPAVWPVPGVALRLLLGEFAVEALRSVRAVPGALAAAGFVFVHPRLDAALAAALREPTTFAPVAR
ncbi:MAG TPA: TIGR01777 family oxidoreductase [Pilimelia sp.]|nr:TIGR01777 family oxidoreductase [Pilimelia sp.]